MENYLKAMERHMPYGITRCYLPPDADECARFKPKSTLDLPTLSIGVGYILKYM